MLNTVSAIRIVYFPLEISEWERDCLSAQQWNSSMAHNFRAVPVCLVSDVVACSAVFTGHWNWMAEEVNISIYELVMPRWCFNLKARLGSVQWRRSWLCWAVTHTILFAERSDETPTLVYTRNILPPTNFPVHLTSRQLSFSSQTVPPVFWQLGND